MNKFNNSKNITLTITHNCNLSCSYCYEAHKNSEVMSLDVAKNIIINELKNTDGYDGVMFDFFGGEPFLEFEKIRELTDFICSNSKDIPFVIFATTNGTLVHGEIQKWLSTKRDCFVCGLSLDGTKEMHDKNRSNSYDDIDLDFFQKLYPKQDVKMTISRETLSNLAKGVIDIHKHGFCVSCNLACGLDWSDSSNALILERELYKLIDFYLNNPSFEVCSILNWSLINIGSGIDKALRYCGAGNEMRAYDCDGKAYPCQFFMPISLGKELASKAESLVFPENEQPEELLDEKCKHCVVRMACPTCYGTNFSATGDLYKRDESACNLTKIIMKANAYFKAKLWNIGRLQMDKYDMANTLKAIIKIQNELILSKEE